MIVCPACKGKSWAKRETTCRRCKGAFPYFLACNTLLMEHSPASHLPHFDGTWEELERLVMQHFSDARIGAKDGVLLIRVPCERFFCGVARLTAMTHLAPTTLDGQILGEEPGLCVTAQNGSKVPARFVEIIVYTHAVIVNDGLPTSESCCEIVGISASAIDEPEPMHPVMMAQDVQHDGPFLHTPMDFAMAIAYWTTYVPLAPSPALRRTFVVTAYHSSGHGDTATTFLVTTDFTRAITAAMKAREYRYRFVHNEHGVAVNVLVNDIPYHKDAFESYDHLPVPADHPCVVFFRWCDDHLHAEWRPEVLRQLGIAATWAAEKPVDTA